MFIVFVVYVDVSDGCVLNIVYVCICCVNVTLYCNVWKLCVVAVVLCCVVVLEVLCQLCVEALVTLVSIVTMCCVVFFFLRVLVGPLQVLSRTLVGPLQTLVCFV